MSTAQTRGTAATYVRLGVVVVGVGVGGQKGGTENHRSFGAALFTLALSFSGPHLFPAALVTDWRVYFISFIQTRTVSRGWGSTLKDE